MAAWLAGLTWVQWLFAACAAPGVALLAAHWVLFVLGGGLGVWRAHAAFFAAFGGLGLLVYNVGVAWPFALLLALLGGLTAYVGSSASIEQEKTEDMNGRAV